MLKTETANNSGRGSPPPDQLLPARRVWERYGIADRTLDRWLVREDLGFPRPLVINRRRYWHENALIDWERRRVATKYNEALRDPG